MTKQADNMAFLDEKWLQDLAERVGNQLHARKEKDMLLYEIEKGVGEIEHVEGRIALLRHELDRTSDTIETLQHRLSDSREESKHLKAEREQAEVEFKRLKDARKNADKKFAALPELIKNIEKISGEIRSTEGRL